jgi:riboflavin synthase alpha subunit
VVAIRPDGDPALLRYVVEKGSIAVDGVSLTLVDVDGGVSLDQLMKAELDVIPELNTPEMTGAFDTLYS